MNKHHLLIVEDQNIIAMDLKHRLIGLGYEVVGVSATGEDAIRLADKLRPDLVLMDIRLRGEIDGIQAAEQIRALADLPVIYLTAHSDNQTLQRARLTEPYGYVLKPFEDRELHMAIEIALYKHSMEMKLRAHERWLAATLSSIGETVIATDAQGRIQFMNPVAETLTGWRQSEAVGRTEQEVLCFASEVSLATQASPIARALQDSRVITLMNQTQLIGRNNRATPIDSNAAPIIDEHDAIVGAVLVARDVTKRRRAEAALHASNTELARLLVRAEELSAAAELANRLRSEILSNISHELRTPLTTIMGTLEIVFDGLSVSEEEMVALVSAARNASDRLLNLMNNLLDMAKLESGGLHIKREEVDPLLLLDEVQALVRSQVEQKGLALEIQLPTEPLPLCCTDHEHLRQILLNLVNNAIKFTARGQITVSVRVLDGPQAQSGGHRQLKISIQDTGIGISRENQAQLFQPFIQADGGTTRRHGGAGLGLRISRRLAELLAGSLTLYSAGENCGTTVTLTIPVE